MAALANGSSSVRRGHALRAHNTLALQSRADAFVAVSSDAELLAALAWAKARRMPVIPLGEGSNVVFAGDVHALVLRQATQGITLLEVRPNAVLLRVAAGQNWHELVRWSLQQGYNGLENLALIPGTAGAAPIQNIGAYGVELQSLIACVHARRIDDGTAVTLDNQSCEFGYRDSIFKRELSGQLIITAIEITLSRQAVVNTDYPALASFFLQHPLLERTPQAVFEAVVSIRRSKLPDPADEPNAGSFFKNPVLDSSQARKLVANFPQLPAFPQADGRVKLSAAWMIEYCGWKGFERDRLGVHPQHALVLVNHGNDSGAQLLDLANEITRSVYEVFAVSLEIEPRVYGASV
ncbi:MAG: UDP-N-acetylmuramate dehydrogenase [Halioglobus sp.]